MNIYPYTTKGLIIGSMEAEAEILGNNHFLDYFQDFMNITHAIDTGKFIITGRKGAGKSAIVVSLMEQARYDKSLMCSLIKKDEFSLETMIQEVAIGEQYMVLFEWIILVRLVKLIIDSGAGEYHKYARSLKEFYEKNAGYIDIDKYVIQEVLAQKEVNFAPLKNQFGFFSKVFGNKLIKAPFYKMISPLRNVVTEVLRMDIYKPYKFYVLFDDLDVNFKLYKSLDQNILMSLIRVTKRYNTEYLRDTKAKVLLFVRDDIADRLNGVDCDKSKIFGSYEFNINWYEHMDASTDEKNTMLRQFINRRLKVGFEALHRPYDDSDPWMSLVTENRTGSRGKSMFKYVLDYTFYLPRDFISIFGDVGQCKMKLPLSEDDVNKLLRKYAIKKRSEIYDELLAVYNADTIEEIFSLLENVSQVFDPTYDEIINMIQEYELPSGVFNTLIEYSLLVPKDKVRGHYFYSYRESNITGNYSQYVYVLPKVLQLYFRR